MSVEELGRRVVACRHWRWMPGMLTEGWRLACVSLHDGAWSATSTLAHREYHYPTMPDFDDPATLGCLVALVREACGDVVAYRCRRVRIDLEAEALVAALEAAPQC